MRTRCHISVTLSITRLFLPMKYFGLVPFFHLSKEIFLEDLPETR